MRLLSLFLSVLLAFSCISAVADAKAIPDFDAGQFMGIWYEIARLDHDAERGLEKVTLHYSLRDDGSIKVLRRGLDHSTQQWREAEGTAYFAETPATGSLRTSFSAVPDGHYNLIELDHVYYNYVVIAATDKSCLWILARTPQLSYPIKQHLISRARQLEFDTNQLIYVTQSADTADYEPGRHVRQ